MEALATDSTSDECDTVKASNVAYDECDTVKASNMKNPKAGVTLSPNTRTISLEDHRLARIRSILKHTLGTATFTKEQRFLLLDLAMGVVDRSLAMEPFAVGMQAFGLLIPDIDLSRDMTETLYTNLTRFRHQEQIKRIVEDTLGAATFNEKLAATEQKAILCLADCVVFLSWPMKQFVFAMHAFGLGVPHIDLSRDMAETLYNDLTRFRLEAQIDGKDCAATDGSGSAATRGGVPGSFGTVGDGGRDANSPLTDSPDRASAGLLANDPPESAALVADEPGMLDAGGEQAREENAAEESLVEGVTFVGSSATPESTEITDPQQPRNSSTPPDESSPLAPSSIPGEGGGTDSQKQLEETSIPPPSDVSIGAHKGCQLEVE